MPKMGDAMEEGTLVKWLKSEGDEVSEGDPIAEIETDKVTLELEAEDSGTLAQLIADEGQDIPVGEAIAFIAGEGEEVPERPLAAEPKKPRKRAAKAKPRPRPPRRPRRPRKKVERRLPLRPTAVRTATSEPLR